MFDLPELYLVSGSMFDIRDDHVRTIEEAIKGGVGIVQLREKQLDDLIIYNMALKLKKICSKHKVPLIIDDRVDIAIACDADGVHIGQEDLPVDIVKKLLGKNKIVGKSTHSLEQAEKAWKEGADYIGVGPVFATNSKKGVCAPVGIELVKTVKKNIPIPFVAIGGIKLDNMNVVLNAGAKSIACITGIISSKNPQNTSKKYFDTIKKELSKFIPGDQYCHNYY